VRVIFLGAPVRTPSIDWPYLKRFQNVGYNTGNLAIGTSLLRQLVVTDYVTPWPSSSFRPEEASDRFDLIVIPAANFLFRAFDFASYAEFIEKTSLPCVMVGLGAQAPRPNAFDSNIPSGTLRLLSVVSERSKTIGVRGSFTAEVMARLGFKNVSVVGCPSLYRTLLPEIKVEKRTLLRRGALRVVINGSRNVFVHSHVPERTKAIESALIDAAIENDWPYVIQSEQPELDILCGGSTDQTTGHLWAISKQLSLKHGADAWQAIIARNYRVFFDIDQWTEFLSTFDFSFGSRLHGTILALTSGTPAVMMTHDTRTSEMADLCRIPSFPIHETNEIDVCKIYNQVSFRDFEERYRTLFRRFVGFLNDNGVEHCLKLTGAPEKLGQTAISQ
jgi:hypothetical protein